MKYLNPKEEIKAELIDEIPNLADDDVADAILIGASNFDKYCAKYTKFGYLIE